MKKGKKAKDRSREPGTVEARIEAFLKEPPERVDADQYGACYESIVGERDRARALLHDALWALEYKGC